MGNTNSVDQENQGIFIITHALSLPFFFLSRIEGRNEEITEGSELTKRGKNEDKKGVSGRVHNKLSCIQIQEKNRD